MSEFNEQYQRFKAVLRAKKEFSIKCDECPIRDACLPWCENLSIEEAENAPTCEEVLLLYILTGETPK